MGTLPPVEEAVARLVTDLTFDTIPADALAGARRLMQDQLALQVASASLPWSRAVLELTRAAHVPGKAHVAASGDQMSAADAAFVNATYGHGFEYDDAHRASSSHPGSAVVSAALAVGEELGATMREVITGIVAGYEVYTRIGNLAAPELLERGFHPHGLLSNFGAAAVVAKMRGFDAETTVHALAIALSHASGTTEYTSSGGSIKRVHSGIGTRNGIRAAEMAAAGITGPTTFLTGGKGFYRTFVGRPVADDAAATFGLDNTFEITRIWIKPYCCCGINHAYIDGARQLAARAADIDSVLLGIQTGGDVIIGNKNANAYAPKIIEHLQYSLPFQFALSTLGKGNGFATHHAYLDGQLDIGPGSDVAALAQKVKIEVTPELDNAYPGRWVGDITVTYTDGTTEHLFIDNPTGTAENPMSQDGLDVKFRDVISGSLGTERGDTLLRAIQSGDPDQPASDFAALLKV
ncbi:MULTISPECIES: MmgE/PrpD family protein [Rhodococcus]|uniref:MmgE/PrpD family protein n=1 Tax=Rhodococcus oxybenzonivorans TaxID=1990687 RepID=A0AAE4V3X8_9NOCA|nr:MULTISPECIES: MmgE/PrpD family protein [Rhodococcus]MDV7242632.1 MmgE/PrpD family protein [Rhodococcus oxybenzonivorans]MDV7268410.1 MmgE/PrpD family protein [Rhodococcus oxybenzonivorans]MDV7276065.1 MmgE/PrpD family protein [Rhodococcus oxybenzonivorans]MDV7332120.1 MmgE/PrpD family protein [Rhodococcus oxybenzonivorans]MDV7344325.1 MmgE/PrpD family protein [Rhodococcus oxybenzonivorans]